MSMQNRKPPELAVRRTIRKPSPHTGESEVLTLERHNDMTPGPECTSHQTMFVLSVEGQNSSLCSHQTSLQRTALTLMGFVTIMIPGLASSCSAELFQLGQTRRRGFRTKLSLELA